jgi:hypothetical protein
MPDAQPFRAETGAALVEAPLTAVLRHALRAGAGRVALRVAPGAPHRWRVARALLIEGALAAGGHVVDGPEGDLLLVGAEAGRATRLCRLLDRLLGGAAAEIWSLERDLPALRAYLAGSAMQEAAPDLAGLDGWLAEVKLTGLVARRHGLRPAGGPGAGAALLRLEVAPGALLARLGGLGADADVLRHALRMLGARLLQALADPLQRREWLGGRVAVPLHLPVPPGIATPGGGGAAGGPRRLVATLPIAAAAEPVALAERRAALAAEGWALELDGLEAPLLPLLHLPALPADLLRLHWSPALAEPASMRALRGLDPARLVVAGVDDAAALDWAAGLGVLAVEGRLADAMQAAAAAPAGAA